MVFVMDNLSELCFLWCSGGQLPPFFHSQARPCQICGALVHWPYFNWQLLLYHSTRYCAACAFGCV